MYSLSNTVCSTVVYRNKLNVDKISQKFHRFQRQRKASKEQLKEVGGFRVHRMSPTRYEIELGSIATDFLVRARYKSHSNRYQKGRQSETIVCRSDRFDESSESEGEAERLFH